MFATDTEEAVREAFRVQARFCRGLGSPFTARVCRAIGERLETGTTVGERVLGWKGNPDAMHDSVPLRLAGALQALATSGKHALLSRLYPPNPIPEKDVLWTEIRKVLADEADEILKWLEYPPQTNEVARSAILMAGLLVVAAETKLPLALYELGSSGGLNLCLDKYFHKLGKVEAGSIGSALRFEPEWKGPSPPTANVLVIRRRGVDLHPIDISTCFGRKRLRAYIWPDQPDRQARTKVAIEITSSEPPRIDEEDAADWIEQNITARAEPGIARVVLHSIAFQYFPERSQQRIVDHLKHIGTAATPRTPLAWLRLEGVGEPGGGIPLRLSLWPHGIETELALANAHGSWIEWH